MYRGLLEVPSGELRPVSDFVMADEGKAVYIDSSTWCVHGEYEARGRSIVPRPRVTAQFAQVYPVVLSWFGDSHVSGSLSRNFEEVVGAVAACNPHLSVLCGDVVNGSGEYAEAKVDGSWFELAWGYVRDRLPNHLWVKGNHDVDPGCLSYYDWYERLWEFAVRDFTILGLDTYNEEVVVPGTSYSFLSLHDVLWLRGRLRRGGRKIVLAHHPITDWHRYAYLALRAGGVDLVLSGHTHEAARVSSSGVECYINGSCAPGVSEPAVSVVVLDRGGRVSCSLFGTDVEVAVEREAVYVRAPEVRELGEGDPRNLGRVPVRAVLELGGAAVSLIVYAEGGSEAQVRLKESGDRVVLRGDADAYVVGRGIRCDAPLHDEWACPHCGSRWRSYFVRAGAEVSVEPPKGRSVS